MVDLISQVHLELIVYFIVAMILVVWLSNIKSHKEIYQNLNKKRLLLKM
jgi:hypothetical protein